MYRLILLLLSCFPLYLQAQEVKGKLFDLNGETIPYASVALYQVSDSSLVTGGASDLEGNFSIKTEPGEYYLEVRFLSYKTERFAADLEEGEVLKLGKVNLSDSESSLTEVEVEGRRNQMRLELDKRVFDVGADINNVGRNASEVLDNIPSITVDVEGNISLRGSENVRILIDGKPSGLILGSPESLQLLQGNQIDRIEVITNPSARYDAEGEVGIINIILKKNQRKGINGSMELNAGYPTNLGGALNLNLRRKKINWFTNLGISYEDMRGSGESYQEFIEDGELFSFESDRVRSRRDLAANLQLGADFYLSEKQDLTFSGSYQLSRGRNSSSNDFFDYNAAGDLINTSYREDMEREPEFNVESSLLYERRFSSDKHKLTAQFQYTLSDDSEFTDYFETSDTTDLNLYQRSTNTEDQTIFLGQMDYIHPLGKDGKFETGVKATIRDVSNDFLVEERLGLVASWSPVGGFDDKLAYKEDIYAAYAMYGNKWNRFSYQAGLRAEYSDIETALLESNERNPRKYLDWFPSASFAYELDKNNTFQASYSRRITRPRFYALLPFVTFSNNRSIWGGNPNLNPEYTHSNELGYLRYFEKGSFLSSIYYRYSTNVIERLTLVNNEGIARRFPVNLDQRHSAGIELSGNYEPNDWLRLTASFNGFYAEITGDYEGQSFYSETVTMNTRASAKIKLPRDIEMQTNFRYEAPERRPQGTRLSLFVWDLGFSKKILDKRGTLVFSIDDVLNTRRWRSIAEGPNFYTESTFQRRQRQFLLSFNYRINDPQAGNKSAAKGRPQ